MEDRPDSVINHITETLLFGEKVKTLGRGKREWILGNRTIDSNEETMTGLVGWIREGTETHGEYDQENKVWRDVTRGRDVSASTPFCFEPKARILAIVKHGSINEKVLPGVFEQILNTGESRRQWPSVKWEVDPILDPKTFTGWLREVDVVQHVELVAKLPNPDGTHLFGELWDDIQEMNASQIKSTLDTASPSGLQNIQDNERVKNHISMSQNGYGYVTAKGKKDGRKSTYDQRKNVDRASIDTMPSQWDQAWGVLKSRVLARAERFIRENTSTEDA
jgi:hypothetical protein